MNSTSSTRPRLKAFVWAFFGLIESIAAFVFTLRIPADPKNDLVLGFSAPRLIILAGILLIASVFFIICLSFFRNLAWLHLLDRQQPAILFQKRRLFYALLFFTGASALLVFLSPPMVLKNQAELYLRFAAPLALAAVVCFQTLIFLFLLQPDWRANLRRENLSRLGKTWLIPALVFLWPFVFFFERLFVINGRLIGIGNDFVPFSYKYKVYLLDFLLNFRIPLWSPSEAAGFPFYSVPATQTFYPLNIPLAAVFAYKGVYGLIDHNWFTILALAIFSLGLYYWLKTFRLNLKAIVFAVLVMSVSFKMGEIIRFTFAIHTAAWFPWILLLATRIAFELDPKKILRDGLALTLVFICFFTAGYLYYMYYSLFLFLPYGLLLVIPKTRDLFWGNKERLSLSSLLGIIGAVCASLLICAPFLYKMLELLGQVTDRTGGNFEFSTVHVFNMQDTIGSLIYPPAAQAEGWYYFGIIGILCILMYLVLATSKLFLANSTSQGKVDSSDWYFHPLVKIILLIWAVVISYISYGRESYLFIFLWKYFPLFSRFRTWGRFNIILVPIIALLLAISYSFLENHLLKAQRKRVLWFAFGFLTSSFLLVLGGQIYLYSSGIFDSYWTASFWPSASHAVYFLVASVFSYLVFGLFILFAIKNDRFHPLRTVPFFVVFFLTAALDIWHVGAFQWYLDIIPETNPPGRLYVTQSIDRMSFDFARTIGKDTVSLSPSFSVGPFSNWYFMRYNKFFDDHAFEDDSRKVLLGMNGRKRFFFSSSITYGTIKDFLVDAGRFKADPQVLQYTGEQLVLELDAPRQGYLSFIDNWDPDWHAKLNGENTPIELLFGTFKSVQVPAGRSRLVFEYVPKFFTFSKNSAQ